MIGLTRERTPQAVPDTFRGIKRQRLTLDLLKQQRALLQAGEGVHSFKSSHWKVVKDQLWIETVNKCAYCEATTKEVAHGDVEHYRPKSIYWWLAYCYDNYLVSCQICNEIFKRDEFPIAGSQLTGPLVTPITTDDELKKMAHDCVPDPINDSDGMSLASFMAQHQAERPYLLNPYVDNPEQYYGWEVEPILRRVYIVPAHKSTKHFVDEAERLYGLNRKELLELRYFFYNIYDTFRLTLADEGISAKTRIRVEKEIQTMKAATAPFAGMIRYFDQQFRHA
ncbi:hypothetical protein J2I47_08045 [Fibrella sp. HMF5335]|uniref:TIGR02646 family protein n=1 Tax=Fibrella rubiginis TaxID=2817060 RepID=A0A939K5I1_9BACT|nr:hypothetical protein [Fibrella rubiginis]MBO0936490.1 hypothetical protein [Fibrella rubiginis]